MKDLEELLNGLIDLGWKPRGIELTKIEIDEEWPIFYWMEDNWDGWYCPSDNTLNDLCSLDSWLWQFVCEKWLYKELKKGYIQDIFFKRKKEYQFLEVSHEYRLMLSSIQPDKEKFLLSNIDLWKNTTEN